MKAAELRIGNWIKVKSNVFTDDLFSEEKCNENHISDLVRNNLDYSYESIPLTEEWFDKFGFDHYSDFEMRLSTHTGVKLSHIKHSDNYMVRVWQYEDMNQRYDSWVYLTKIKHVHQLQNLYHALTGKELNTENL